MFCVLVEDSNEDFSINNKLANVKLNITKSMSRVVDVDLVG